MPRLCPPAKLDAAMELSEDDLDEGLDALAVLVRKYAKDPRVRYAYGVSLLDADRTAEALEHLEFAERRGRDLDRAEALQQAYFELGMIVHAERLLQRTGGDLNEAIDVEAEMLRNHGPGWRELPRKDLLAFERARVSAVRRRSDAVAELTRLARRQPGWCALQIARAGVALTAGDVETFYEAAAAALEAGPDDAQALLHAARAAFLREGT
ncbi:MAG: hypothetical protein WD336_09185, partial [Trueperaceae bacterium]